MTILHSLILGIIEGLTEFLPVSSTFHLITASRLLGLTQTEFISLFEVVIQSGAILSLLFIYTKTLLHNSRLLSLTIISFVPTAILGGLLYPIIKGTFFLNSSLQLSVFIAIGLVFFLLEALLVRKHLVLHYELADLTNQHAVLIGFAQALAIIPGVSRSGIVLIIMLLLGYRRDESARYTFLLSIPTILAASALDLYQGRHLFIGSSPYFLPLLIGFVSAFITAYFVVHWLLLFLRTHTLRLFAWYRLIVGTLLAL